MEYLFRFGLILVGGYFAFSGFMHFVRMTNFIRMAEHFKVPSPEISVIVTGFMLLIGGIGIMFWNFWPAISILLLLVFLLIVTPWMHGFWRLKGEQRMIQLQLFLKNLALFGTLLSLLPLAM